MILNKKITLHRFVHGEVTFGKLHLEWLPDHPDIYTIELPWRDNKPGVSCIPQGIYNGIPHHTTKYPNVWELLYVPNRTGILIHSGNFASNVKLQNGAHAPETEGCIMVGLGIEENVPMITKSKLAMEYLRQVLGIDNFSIEVKN